MKKIVYVDGVFDLFHIGHVRFLKRAKSLGDILIVGVVSDEDAKSYKRQPIIPYIYRYDLLNECGLADKVVKAELTLSKEFIDKHEINVVVHGDDDLQESFFQIPRILGIMKYVPYTNGISTSNIIEWFFQRYKKYTSSEDIKGH